MPDGHRPSPLPNVRLPQPPPGPPPSTSKPSSLPLPPPIGLLRNGSYIPVQASGVTQPPHIPNQAAVSGSTDPPLPSEPAGPLSPDPPLPLSPPPKHPLPPPPERPSAYSKPPQKSFGFPPHLPGLSFLPVAFILLHSVDTYQSTQSGWRSAFSACLRHRSLCADLHVKKRKRDMANLDDEVKSVDDMPLDEGEIPNDGQNGAAGFTLDTDML